MNETVISFTRGNSNGITNNGVTYAPVFPGIIQMPNLASTWTDASMAFTYAVPWVNRVTKQLWVDNVIINSDLNAGSNISISDYQTNATTGKVYRTISASFTAFDCVSYVANLSAAQAAYTGCGTGRSSSSPCYANLPTTGYPGILFIFPDDSPCPTFVPLTIGSDPAYSQIETDNDTSNITGIADGGLGGSISAYQSAEKYTLKGYNKWIRINAVNSGSANLDVVNIAHSLSGVTAGTYGGTPSTYSVSYPKITVDAAGHVSAAPAQSWTMPYFWDEIKSSNSTTGVTQPVGTSDASVTPDTHADSLLFKAQNKWIAIQAVEGSSSTTPVNQDRIDFAHVLAPENTAGTYGTIIKIPQVTVDAAGHITGVSELGIDYYQKIYVENNTSGTAVSTDSASYIEADDNDSFKIKGYNKWIVVKAKTATGQDDGLISISHKLSSVSSSSGTSFGTTTKVPKVTFDEAGHISAIEEVDIAFPSVTIPDTKNVVTNSDSGTSDVTTAITNGNLRLNHVQGTSAKSSHILKGEGDSEVYKDANDAKVKFHSKPYELRVSDTSTTLPSTDKETIENGDYIKLAKQDKSGSWSLADEKRVNIDTASKPEMESAVDRIVKSSNNDTGNAGYEGTYYKNGEVRIKRNVLGTCTLSYSSGVTYTVTNAGGLTIAVGNTIECTIGTTVYYDVVTAVSGNSIQLRTATNFTGTCTVRNDDYIRLEHEARQQVGSTSRYQGSMVYFRKATDSVEVAESAANDNVLIMNIVMIDGGEF